MSGQSMPAAGAAPRGWPGWPEGKRFAFVLTHDVEGLKGVSRVEQLMDLEIRDRLPLLLQFCARRDRTG